MQSNDTKHWSELSSNPISPEAMALVKVQLQQRHKGPHPGLDAFLNTYVKGKKVLDIGVVEHDLSFTSHPSWKHGMLKEQASSIVGIDILPEAIEQLVTQGFDIRLCDVTSDADLGERFDVVYIGDVIEHVNDPVRMLKFASKHLLPNGKIIVTTPCPFWWRNIQLMIKDSTYIGNVDHVSWVVPANALELGMRAGVGFSHYYTLETIGNSIPKKTIKWLIEKTLGKNELFTWAYAYIFKGK